MLFLCFYFFFFNDTATTEIYTLSLHDALPIWQRQAFLQAEGERNVIITGIPGVIAAGTKWKIAWQRSEEHTSELQSPYDLVCRLLLEKKKKKNKIKNRQKRKTMYY